MDPAAEASLPSLAEQAFLDHLARRESGKAESLQELIHAHPELERELMALSRRWQRFAALRELAVDHDESDADGARGEALALLALASLDEPRRAIDRYEPGEEIARGAQGSVRRVLDKSLDRFLAMKVLHGGARPATKASRVVRRFLDEARITARLDHPSIVPVHDIGLDHDGHAFFTMKLVRGLSLREAFEAQRGNSPTWTLPRLAQVLLRVAETMAFAHDRGVLHRDLKPSNVMLGDYGEVYVMDWGLARVVGDAARVAELPEAAREDSAACERDPTLEGDVIGTPHYMPPEQAAGRHADVGVEADVYALGAMLYHLLTGRAPYEAEAPSPSTAREVLQSVLAGPPPPVFALARTAPAELEAICVRAMARTPKDRYANMGELAADLRAWIEGRVVRAYERGALAELRKWIRRNRALSATGCAAIAAIVGGLWWSGRVEASGRREADQARARADASLADLQRLSEVVVLSELETRAAALWPESPEQVDALRKWLEDAQALASNLPAHERTLAELRAGTSSVTGLGRTWWEGTLADLVDRLHVFARVAIPDVQARLSFAETIAQRSIVDERAAWDEALQSIAGDARYAGLVLRPLPGLVPIGRDRGSGLWEFWHVRTGSRPRRDSFGALWPDDDMGLVFVLLPGERFWMGAQKTATDAPNYDPLALEDELPLVEVELDPFLISKYEMTQGQWLRATGKNPARYVAGSVAAGRPLTLRHPIEFVTWRDCKQTLQRLGLALPTEAQWEYGARGGTDTAWWTGPERESLRGAANIADKTALEMGVNWEAARAWPEFEDGFVLHAPVGSFAPNPFGLHDVIGNVFEWSADTDSPYSLGRRAGDGAAPNTESIPIMRGGCYEFGVSEGRSAARGVGTPDFTAPLVGLRPVMSLR
jgi:formylglycine-generating enzyme required for sulfatase activity